jgi:hypothetical protein
MNRYTLHVPLQDNHGRSLGLVHASIAERILDVADGYTTTDGFGAWRNPENGIRYSEPVRLYHVDSHDELYAELRAIAQSVARVADQDAVYLTVAPLTASLITRDVA